MESLLLLDIYGDIYSYAWVKVMAMSQASVMY